MNPQYVYFAAACDKIKIGCSRRPHDRIWQVSEWIPFPIKLLATMPGGYDVETAIHSMFDADWSQYEDPQLKGKALPPELRTKMIGLLQTHGLWVLQ